MCLETFLLVTTGLGVTPGISWGKNKDTSRHPTVYRAAATTRNSWPQMSIVQGCETLSARMTALPLTVTLCSIFPVGTQGSRERK